MTYLDSYTNRYSDAEQIASIKNTSYEVYNNVESKFDFRGELTGLLLGNVQSGKTSQMLGVISLLADKGYRLFLLLTTDNVDLQQQTFNRVKASLPDFSVLSEKDEIFFNPSGTKPIVVVLKKNASVLRKWGNILVNTNIASGVPLCIFDDEADAASLNNLVNKNRTTTINRNLTRIKSTAACSLYFQVTATPQAVILQSSISGWKPQFINYFKPGAKYKGGSFFYSNPRSYCIKFTDADELNTVTTEPDSYCPQGLRDSIMSFLVVCAHKKLNGESNCNFMIHPSTRVAHHNSFASTVEDHLNLLVQSTDEEGFEEALKTAWIDLQRTRPNLEHFEDIKETVIELLSEMEINVITLNSRSFVNRNPNDPNRLNLANGFNIIVGGNTLGRGLTFPHLQTVYYCRTSKKPNADTFWQHSRIFGYDREEDLVRIFLPEHLHSLFVALNEGNELLIKQIEAGLTNIEIIYPQGINPTRQTVLDNQFLNMIVGGVNLFASNPLRANVETVNSLVENYASETSVEVDFDLIIRLLSLVRSYDSADFNTEKFINCIKALQQNRPSTKCRLIVRTNRDIAKGTGTLLSENDRRLGDSYPDNVVMTLYRVKGGIDKGWAGHPLWIPNIKFPGNLCFYNTETIESTISSEPPTQYNYSGNATHDVAAEPQP